MNKTKIEWVKNPDGTQGYTWNPITGCLNGCEYCYARKLANTRLKERYLANTNVAPFVVTSKKQTPYLYDIDPFYPRFWEDRLLSSFSHDVISGREKGIFVCDMGELFGDWVPKEWQDEVFRVIELFPEHRFYLLTKQPQNLIKFNPFPPNCWVGVTVTDASSMSKAGFALLEIEAKVKYLSIEPFLSPFYPSPLSLKSVADWVIIGAQTKPYKPPLKIWVDEIIEACKKASIPYFLKDNLAPLFAKGEGYKRVAVLTQDMPKGVEIDH